MMPPLISRQDLTCAFRTLRQAPGFSVAAVMVTALGIGANAAIFAVVKQVLLQPLPYAEPSRLVDVNEYAAGRPTAVSPPNFMDWRAQNRTLSGITAYGSQVMTLAGGATPARISGGRIEPELFDVGRCSFCSAPSASCC